jgi:hypothetical protein
MLAFIIEPTIPTAKPASAPTAPTAPTPLTATSAVVLNAFTRKNFAAFTPIAAIPNPTPV